MKKEQATSLLKRTWVTAVAALALANTPAHAAPVWNVNIGNQVTSSDRLLRLPQESLIRYSTDIEYEQNLIDKLRAAPEKI
jgi:hypothetical protein